LQIARLAVTLCATFLAGPFFGAKQKEAIMGPKGPAFSPNVTPFNIPKLLPVKGLRPLY